MIKILHYEQSELPDGQCAIFLYDFDSVNERNGFGKTADLALRDLWKNGYELAIEKSTDILGRIWITPTRLAKDVQHHGYALKRLTYKVTCESNGQYAVTVSDKFGDPERNSFGSSAEEAMSGLSDFGYELVNDRELSMTHTVWSTAYL